MEKIVILSDKSERSDTLVSLLHMLFPECEINSVSRQQKADSEAFHSFCFVQGQEAKLRGT